MKIALISPNPNHLRQMAASLGAQSHQVQTFDGGKSRMRAVAESCTPDLMVVEGMCCDAEELVQVEQTTMQHPRMSVVLLCSNHTPEFLIGAMRAGVREVLPSPAEDAALLAMVRRIEQKSQSARSTSRAKVLAFVPCKGGSGATFLATNLGAHLAESSSVLLIDLNLQFGDALAVVHDGRPATTLADVAAEIGRLDASFLAAHTVRITPNFQLLAAPDDPGQAVEIRPDHIAAILAVAETQYDFVLLDMGRHLDPMALQVFDRCDRIFPVLQLELPALRNARRLLDVFRSLGYGGEKLELLVNRYEKSSPIGLDQVNRALGDVPLRLVPNAWRDVSAAIEEGKPLSKSGRSSPVTRKLAEFATSLQPPTAASRSLLQRILKRA